METLASGLCRPVDIERGLESCVFQFSANGACCCVAGPADVGGRRNSGSISNAGSLEYPVHSALFFVVTGRDFVERLHCFAKLNESEILKLIE